MSGLTFAECFMIGIMVCHMSWAVGIEHKLKDEGIPLPLRVLVTLVMTAFSVGLAALWWFAAIGTGRWS